ncbi:hypothetical protein SK128_023845 [Halocaridina rubra]|uniref:Uncharacterized protein n=1 Tax=Halocaridina rubra TaxID=373956 RepID=A0AAN9A8N7_HALRR
MSRENRSKAGHGKGESVKGSVLVSWLLEDTTPHSLGDSLIAIRAGWMGKDCSLLYPECPLQPDPHPAAKEAITFFSRLQFAATGPQTDASDDQPSSAIRPQVDRIDSIPELSNQTPEPPHPSHMNNPYVTPTPNPHFHHLHSHPMVTNSPPPAYNYRLPEDEPSQQPNRGLINDDKDTYNNAAEIQAYYTRYKGQGPMAVPGSQYSSKYGQYDDEKNMSEDRDKQLYDKYDSPSVSSVEGEISGSNSVSGMALQDRPTGNNVKVWEEFFKAGLYGANVPQTSLNKKEEQASESSPEKSTRLQKPVKRPVMTSLNKIGALLPDQPGFYANPGFSFVNKPSGLINQGIAKPSRTNRPGRPYFNLTQLQKRQQTGIPSNTSPPPSATPYVKKYKFGLRRGLPASNVNGYNAYINNNNNLYQRQKPWYAYITPPRYRPNSSTPETTPKTIQTTTTTPSTTAHPLASKDIAPFGPEDAVTDVMRNELLYEYIRDRQGNIPIEDKRSLS